MILNAKETTLAYRCPVCGTTVMSIVGIFTLQGEHIKLKCSECGESELLLSRTKDGKIRLTVPCTVCPSPHYYVLSDSVFFEKEIFTLSCAYTGIEICFIGKEEAVRRAAEASNAELLKLLEQAGADSLAALRGDTDEESTAREDDIQAFDVVNFILCELEDEHKIHCRCPEGTSHSYKFDLVGRDHDTVLIYCDTCEASTAVKIGDPVAANAFLHTDELHLS